MFSINRTHKTFLRIKSQRRRHQNLSERNLEYDIPEKNEYLDMGIFMAFFIVVSLVCLIMIIKVCNWIKVLLIRLSRSLSVSSRRSKSKKTGAAEVKPYGDQLDLRKLSFLSYFQIKIPWLENSSFHLSIIFCPLGYVF